MDVQLSLFDTGSASQKPEKDNSAARANKLDAASENPSSTDTPTLKSPYRLIRSRRKTLSVQVKHAEVEVRAPLRAPLYWIEQMIEQRREWIEQQVQTQRQHQKEIFRVIDKARLSLLEQPHYEIRFCVDSTENNYKVANRKTAKVVESDRYLNVYFPDRVQRDFLENRNYQNKSEIDNRLEQLATEAFLSWLKQKASSLLSQKVFERYEQMNLKPSARTASLSEVKFRTTKSKWGHCTSEGVIQLNPSLLMAPRWVCDYVIVHELCHLRHRNHSKAFWGLVERFFPEWKAAEQWLDERGHQLAIGSLL